MFKKEKVKDLHYSVIGFLSADEIQASADEILLKHGADAKMPGFRPGHVPLEVLRQKFNTSALGEAVDKLMNKDLSDFTLSKKIRLASSPKADVSKWVIGKDLEYTLEFDILPTLPQIDLSKYTVIKKITDMDESEVEKAIDNLRKANSAPEKQKEDYKASNGDTAVIDFKGFVNDVAFEGGESKNYHLILGSNSFIPGFEEQIIGHKAGDTFDINVSFPKDYHSCELADKKAKFEIKIHEIHKNLLPEFNDDFAKKIGKESVKDLREHIENIIKEQYDLASKHFMRDELLEILADKVKLDLPESLVQQEFDMAKKEFDSHAGHAHAKNDKFEEKKERKEAEKRVKLGLILAEWGAMNNIVVNNNELQQAIWNEGAKYPDPKQVYEYYNKNPNALSMLRGILFERKTIDAMLEKVKLKEKKVKPEELFKQRSI